MKRRYWIPLALAWSACKPPPAPGELLPESVAGAWRRTSLGVSPPPMAGTLRALQADYEGPGKLTVYLYEMKPGLAFEAVQHWRVRPNAVRFDKGNYLWSSVGSRRTETH